MLYYSKEVKVYVNLIAKSEAPPSELTWLMLLKQRKDCSEKPRRISVCNKKLGLVWARKDPSSGSQPF